MIDVDDPKVRKVLIFIAMLAAIYLIIALTNIFLQSAEMDKARAKICDDLEKNPGDIGVRVLGDSAYTLCRCNQTANGTWDCVFDEAQAMRLTDNMTKIREDVVVWK